MATEARPMQESSAQLGLIVPVVLGAVTIGVWSVMLPSLAGPFVLPEFKVQLFVTHLWVIHGLLAAAMGLQGGTYGQPRTIAVATVLAGLMAGAAALFYTRLGLLPATGVTFGGLSGMGLGLGLLGAVIGVALEKKGIWPAIGYVIAGLFAIGVVFLGTGAVSGKVSRTVIEKNFGMTTGQQDVDVPGVPVILTDLDGKARLYEGKTNERGNYVFNGPPVGEYKLFVHDTEPTMGTGQWIEQRVKVRSVMDGLSVGMGAVSLPTYTPGDGAPSLPQSRQVTPGVGGLDPTKAPSLFR